MSSLSVGSFAVAADGEVGKVLSAVYHAQIFCLAFARAVVFFGLHDLEDCLSRNGRDGLIVVAGLGAVAGSSDVGVAAALVLAIIAVMLGSRSFVIFAFQSLQLETVLGVMVVHVTELAPFNL